MSEPPKLDTGTMPEPPRFNETTPTHRCRVCGAFWRLWLAQDTLHHSDSWSLCGSDESFPCCDNAYMGGQILPTTRADMEAFFLSVDKNGP